MAGSQSPPGYSAVAGAQASLGADPTGASATSPAGPSSSSALPSSRRASRTTRYEEDDRPTAPRLSVGLEGFSTDAARRGSAFLQQQQQRLQAQAKLYGQDPTVKAAETKADSLLSSIIAFLDNLPPIAEWPQAIFNTVVVNPLTALAVHILNVVTSPRTHRIVLRLSVLTALLWTALFVAVFAYIGFVRVWLPQVGLRKTVWLQYGEARPPYAHLNFLPSTGSQFYHSSVSEEVLNTQSHFFADDQEYDVTLELQVPLTAANVDLGNFMATLDLRNEKNQTVWKVSRPAILLQEPLPVRALSTLSLFLSRNAPRSTRSRLMSSASSLDDDEPSFLSSTSSFSWSIPTQLITIPLLRRKVLQPSKPTLAFLEPSDRDGEKREQAGWASRGSSRVVQGIISVGRADADRFWYQAAVSGAPGGGNLAIGSNGAGPDGLWAGSIGAKSRGELQTHSASLRFDANLTGIRYIMYHHPVFSFLLFTSLFFGFEVAAGVIIWLLVTLYTSPSISERLMPSLAVEENWVQGVRRRPEAADTGRRTRTEVAAEERGEEEVTDSDLTETEYGALRRWTGLAGESSTSEAESREAQAGSVLEEEDVSGLRRRAGVEEPAIERARSSATDPRAAAAAAVAAAAASIRSRDEEERREAEIARLRHEAMLGRRMTEITGTAEGGSSVSPATSRPPTSAPQQAQPDPFLEMLPPTSRRVLSRLDEETEEETVSGSTDRGSLYGDEPESDEDARAASVEASVLRRQGVGKDEEEASVISSQTGTVGGSTTSRGTSSLAGRSFGRGSSVSSTTASTIPSISTTTEGSQTPTRFRGYQSTLPASAERTPTSESVLQGLAQAQPDPGAEADEETVSEDDR